MKNKNRTLFKPSLLKPSVVGALIGAFTCPAFAVSEFTLIGGVGLEAHDNAGLTHSDEQSDTKRIVNADIGYKKNDGALNADVDYRAEYGDYVHDVQSDQTAINGSAQLTWQIAPRQLDVILDHQISQQLTDRRGLNVASNREERSVVTAGVDGYLHLSPVDSVVLAPRFSDVNYQDSNNADSKHAAMAAIWDHKISKISALDLKANYDDVKFDDSVNNYKAPSVMLSLSTALARLHYQVGIGGNRINPDNGKDFSGSSAIAAIDYHGDDAQDWGASYVRELTDSSVGLSAAELQLTNFQANDSNSNQFDIVQEDKLDAYWRDRIGVSSRLTLNTGYQKEDYKLTPRDQNIAYVQMSYLYTINSRWSTGLDARFDRTKFLDDPRSRYDTTRLYVSAIYHPSRPLEVRFSVGQEKRNADTSALSYTDKIAMIGMRYRFF